jgi:hypothetical protein
MGLPLYGFVEGDTLGILLIAEEGERVGALARRLLEAASLRVAPSMESQVVYRGAILDPGLTVAQAGLSALDRLDVRRRRG